jgi:hypothetical protein
MVRKLLAFLVTFGLALALGAPALGAGPVVRFRPNLQTVPPADLEIVVTPNGNRQLRLTNEVSNLGSGPIELKPRKRDCDHDGSPKNDRTAFQRIYEDSNSNDVFDRDVDTTWVLHKVGCFTFIPVHGHWHFDDYASYQLFDLTGELVKEHSKVGFCLVDSEHVSDGTLPGDPGPDGYYGSVVSVCGNLQIQGVSVGWADSYLSGLPGQFIGIGGVADGNYCLVSTADPDNQIKETDETDNEARLQIAISGDTVQTLPDPC